MRYQSLRLVAALGVAATVPIAPSHAGTWSSPKLLSSPEGFDGSGGPDQNGSATAVWMNESSSQRRTIRAASKISQGLWQSPVTLSLGSTALNPIAHVSATGLATAIWLDGNGTWTADRPEGGSWTKPKLLIPGQFAPYFVMSASGAALLAWATGGSPRSTTPGAIMTLSRPRGADWGSPQTAASGIQHFSLSSVALSDSGDALLAWDTFDAICSGYRCTESNFRLFAARRAASSGNFQISPVLAGPDANSHGALLTADADGDALLAFTNALGLGTSMTQMPGQAYGAPVIISGQTGL